MRAVIFSEYGDVDVLRLVDLPAPEPGPGQVRIAVRATAVNPVDWKIRSGALAEIMPVPLPTVPGVDVAGVVDRVGPAVTGIEPGDEVFGKATSGSYAQLALASRDAIASKPGPMSWELAAALPVAVTTAHHALAQLDPAEGDTIVIDGAAGGVGTAAVQLARHRGATVIGTASPANHDYLRSLGAIPVGYGDGLADRVRRLAPDGVSAALDASGRGSLPALIELAGDPGRVITIADATAAQLGALSVYDEPRDQPGILAEAAAMILAGRLTMPIAGTYPMADVAAAHRESQAGHVRGKLVLSPI
ncbi:NADP-dependent oxidoreductase [Rugosimonospora africana]|uniref:Oxidoreductase n=1 Tax=Rugosimonospora africana TaxID=556532 RepID=A0A8J3VT81_9ACTN|nr:NADP-dependent oxidoreductase [Rugosimonospora africana]GIH17814.1 oxidoreductase [Rugosimonospora africana]